MLDAINTVYDRATDEHDKIMEGLETEDLESVAHELEEPTDLLEADDEATLAVLARFARGTFGRSLPARLAHLV